MSFFSWLISRVIDRRSPRPLHRSVLTRRTNALPFSQDTLAAIDELSLAVENNPDAVEIYLALGNLFRSQGEIERAVQVRNSLIVRQNLKPQFKAKAWYELGRDFKRGGLLDRAQGAFEQAQAIVGNDPALLDELTKLAADCGDYEKASQFSGQLKNHRAEAHYLVVLAHRLRSDGQQDESKKMLHRALKAHPGSVEAWLEILLCSLQEKDYGRLSKDLSSALSKVTPELRFLLLEGLLEYPHLFSAGGIIGACPLDNGQASCLEPGCCHVLLPILEKQPQDLLLYYYGSLIALRCQDKATAQEWLEKTLLLDADFWPARLELLAHSIGEQTLTPVFRGQLEFFLARARRVKKFVCLKCGLKREQLFFICPRCQNWHTISFRLSLSD